MALDIIFLLFAAMGFWTGYSKGIISTVFTILSFTIGLLASFKLAPAFTNFLEQVFNSTNPMMFIAGFILSFVVMMLVLRMLARGMEGLLKSANINIVNQLIGGAVLSAVFILVYSGLVWFGDKSHMIDPQTKQESITYVYTKEFPGQMQGIAQKLKPVFTEFWNETMDFMDRIQETSLRKTETDPTIYDIEEE